MNNFRVRTWHKLVEASLQLPPAHYIVGEAIQVTPGYPYGRTFSAGCPDNELITNWSNYRVDDVLLSPTAGHTRLLSTKTNQVEIAFEPPDKIVLTIDLECDADLLLARLPRSDDQAEIDLYANPLPIKGGEESMSSQSVLEAFAALGAGEFPQELSFCSSESFPRRGLRSVVTDAFAQKAGAHPENLLAELAHPFQERFLRLPMQELLSPVFARGKQIVISVRIGGMAEEVAQRLEGKLFVNHVLFWNRLLAQRDPLRSADDSIRGRDAIVLQIEDIRSGAHYFDHRFCPHEDPSRLFRLLPDEHEDVCHVSFLGTPVPPHHTRIQYLLPTDWSDLNVELGSTCFEHSGPIAFAARTPIAPLIDLEPEDAMRARNTCSLAMHPHTFPGELPMTTCELKDLINRWMPPQIARFVQGDKRDVIRFEPQMRVPKNDANGMIQRRPARCVTVCWLRLQPRAPLTELEFQRRWLSQQLTRLSPANIVVEVDFEESATP